VGRTVEDLADEVENWIEAEMRRISPQSYRHEHVDERTRRAREAA
jgi:1-acyl-sn-glycerol-3-phosphate acyltransferase